MPNIKQQKKRNRTNEARRGRNIAVRSRVKTFVKKADRLISEGPAPDAAGAVREAIAELDIAARKGVIHKRNAARRKSRLQRRANARAAT
jgi:small subunit ribosomal protein S20